MTKASLSQKQIEQVLKSLSNHEADPPMPEISASLDRFFAEEVAKRLDARTTGASARPKVRRM